MTSQIICKVALNSFFFRKNRISADGIIQVPKMVLQSCDYGRFLQKVFAGASFFALGYLYGRYLCSDKKSSWKVVSKSFESGAEPIKTYCLQHSTPLNEVQQRLMQETLKLEQALMLGAPEVISLNAALVRALNSRKVIDIGVFTGASSLASALALPPEGKVIACDVNEEYTQKAREKWAEAGVQDKIDLYIAPASQTLQDLIDAGQSGEFDFAFIDADKCGYDTYYELCLQLLRPGGIIAFDNTLWFGRVLKNDDECDESTLAIKRLNEKLAKDSKRAFVVQLNVGDGYTIAVKL